MKYFIQIGTLALLLCAAQKANAQFNPLWIPDTLTGPVYNLTMQDTFKQFYPGQQTITSAFNGNWWGPTLIFNQGDTVYLNVHNRLNDTSTVHWHGFHLPAVMDGGPHQVIPPGTIWKPYWKVTNHAATYWYHPHLHMMTEKQLTHGLGGFIIVRDSIESSLALPRTYGVDDIPLAITDRKFNSSNQLVDVNSHYGDTVLTNGVLNAAFTAPAQWVRFRLLDIAQERAYNIGFSDNRKFYVIGNDGSLLDTPVVMTRLLMAVGERYEIMVDLSGQQGSSVDLMAFNAEFGNQQDLNGSEPPQTPAPFGNKLGRRTFRILRINIGAPTANPITALPAKLLPYTTIDPALATRKRTKVMADDPSSGFLTAKSWINKAYFDFNRTDDYIRVDSTEIWTLRDSSIGSHAFHIHDIEFKIIDINGNPPPPHQRGWKDVVYVRHYSQVRFITTFNTYYDTIWPFMYHCHILFHEDEGMMRQFVVVPSDYSIPTTGVSNLIPADANSVNVYPNPAGARLVVETEDPNMQLYYVRILNAEGRTLYMLPQPQSKNDIDISTLRNGIYFVNIIDMNKHTITKKFVKGDVK
ncbi:MAG: multicopper oxidase domain-containing protein [Bacteroidota bacterium]